MSQPVPHAPLPGPNPDRPALIRTGNLVRARLAADPSVHRVPVDKAELFAVSDFLTPLECTQMMAMIDRTAQPSKTFDHGYGVGYRTSYSGDVDRSAPFVRMIERRIDDLLGLPNAFGETIQGQRYAAGQEFKPHNDWFYTRAAYWKDERRRGGQRSWTAMAYLNEVEEGGTTDFIRLGASIPPQPGALIVWNNARPDGSMNDDTMHAGTPVVRGTKYVITKWYRTREWG